MDREKARSLAKHWGVDHEDLNGVTLPYSTVALLPRQIALRCCVIPVDIDEHNVRLAMKNPLDIFTADEVRLLIGKEVVPVMATELDIRAAIARSYHYPDEPTAWFG